MNIREKFSAVLICVGIVLALLPLSGSRSFTAKPKNFLTDMLDSNLFFTVDQVAKFMVNEDSSVTLIDIRKPEEFREGNLPGSVNIPYNVFLDKDPASVLTNNTSKIFYSNDDLEAGYAVAVARGLKIKNTYYMKGGLNEWFKTVMNSDYKGERISARENALFETRTRAKKLFNAINSLPDSLKMKYIASKQLAAKKLDGGCE